MKSQLENIKALAEQELSACTDLKVLETLRVKYLGKKGELTAILKQMGKLSAEERPVMGQLANEVRQYIENEISSKASELNAREQEEKIRAESIDVTLPGKKQQLGSLHPLTQVMNEVTEIFMGMGYDVVEGPEIETEYYNFTALNIPENHPARDTQDTFYSEENFVLRTATSTVQIRTMENKKPPIRIISPGRVYRSDAIDATHSPLFHQIEGLVIDKGVTMSDLKGTLETLMKKLYGEDCKIRLRPHYFPFTEPSAEVDIMCFNCGGKGCPMCKNEGWIEILGAGMVHPKVLEICGIDSNEYGGFAFGLGLERIVMRRYGIKDIRLLIENDLRFLSQF